MLSDIELREVFHFCFLEHLLRISDPKIYVLKGGVNLRFYFNSPRYSEDMDLDVLAGNVTTLSKNCFKILEDQSFRRRIKTFGIDDLLLNDPSKSKQTETTQRFKLRLVNRLGETLPTKIEFSRRNKNLKSHDYELSRLDLDLGRKYNSLSYLAQHYCSHAAIVQKIKALAGRKEVQARDVFDIFILDIGGHSSKFSSKSIDTEALNKAKEALLSISYQDYKTKVLEFLSNQDKERYSGENIWDEIRTRVLELIEK